MLNVQTNNKIICSVNLERKIIRHEVDSVHENRSNIIR